jgi:hypothetical protein
MKEPEQRIQADGGRLLGVAAHLIVGALLCPIALATCLVASALTEWALPVMPALIALGFIAIGLYALGFMMLAAPVRAHAAAGPGIWTLRILATTSLLVLLAPLAALLMNLIGLDSDDPMSAVVEAIAPIASVMATTHFVTSVWYAARVVHSNHDAEQAVVAIALASNTILLFMIGLAAPGVVAQPPISWLLIPWPFLFVVFWVRVAQALRTAPSTETNRDASSRQAS